MGPGKKDVRTNGVVGLKNPLGIPADIKQGITSAYVQEGMLSPTTQCLSMRFRVLRRSIKEQKSMRTVCSSHFNNENVTSRR